MNTQAQDAHYARIRARIALALARAVRHTLETEIKALPQDWQAYARTLTPDLALHETNASELTKV